MLNNLYVLNVFHFTRIREVNITKNHAKNLKTDLNKIFHSAALWNSKQLNKLSVELRLSGLIGIRPHPDN